MTFGVSGNSGRGAEGQRFLALRAGNTCEVGKELGDNFLAAYGSLQSEKFFSPFRPGGK